MWKTEIKLVWGCMWFKLWKTKLNLNRWTSVVFFCVFFSSTQTYSPTLDTNDNHVMLQQVKIRQQVHFWTRSLWALRKRLHFPQTGSTPVYGMWPNSRLAANQFIVQMILKWKVPISYRSWSSNTTGDRKKKEERPECPSDATIRPDAI